MLIYKSGWKPASMLKWRRGSNLQQRQRNLFCVFGFWQEKHSFLQISIPRRDLSSLQKAKNHPEQPEIRFDLNKMLSFIPQSTFCCLFLFFFSNFNFLTAYAGEKKKDSSQKEMQYFYFIYFSSVLQQKTQLLVHFSLLHACLTVTTSPSKNLVGLLPLPVDGGDCVKTAWRTLHRELPHEAPRRMREAGITTSYGHHIVYSLQYTHRQDGKNVSALLWGLVAAASEWHWRKKSGNKWWCQDIGH